MEIDSLDLRLLAALQEDGQLCGQTLAEAVNLPLAECEARKAALENSGIINGYFAHVDRQKTGFDIFAFVAVNLIDHDRNNAEKFANFIKLLPQVLEVHALTEEMDFLVKVVANDLESLSDLINGHISDHASVKSVKTLMSLETIKETVALPL